MKLEAEAPARGAARYNCEYFLIEELVVDEQAAAKPVDYRVYVNGDTVLWIELTIHDEALHTARQAHHTHGAPACDCNTAQTLQPASAPVLYLQITRPSPKPHPKARKAPFPAGVVPTAGCSSLQLP